MTSITKGYSITTISNRLQRENFSPSLSNLSMPTLYVVLASYGRMSVNKLFNITGVIFFLRGFYVRFRYECLGYDLKIG